MRVGRTAVLALALALSGCSAGPATPGDAVPADRVADAPPAAATTAPPVPEPSPPPLAEAIRAWEEVAGEHFRQSAGALGKVSAASAAGDEEAVRDGCTILHDANAVGLQAHLPTPDPALTAELQRMIDDMNSATHACLRFVENRQSADAEVYQDYLARAVEHLGLAKAVLDADRRGR